MADLEAIEVLTQAKERLFECGWVNRPFSTRTHEQAAMFCLEEALVGGNAAPTFVNEYSPAPIRRATQYVQSAIGPWEIPDFLTESVEKLGLRIFHWNDQQKSASPIFEVIDDAILIAKEVSVIPRG